MLISFYFIFLIERTVNKEYIFQKYTSSTYNDGKIQFVVMFCKLNKFRMYDSESKILIVEKKVALIFIYLDFYTIKRK